MKRFLLLAAFSLHVSVGGLCFAPVAAMAQETAGTNVDIVAMTPKEGVVCVSVQLMSFASGQQESMQGGCADGHCLKMRTPEPLVTASHAPTATEPATLPSPIVEISRIPADCNTDIVANESPPRPQGIDAVVIRE